MAKQTVPKLVVAKERFVVQELELPEGGAGGSVIFVGRNESNDICLPSLRVSKRHASVERRGGHVYVTDLGSTNGTLVNGIRLEPYRELELFDGDAIDVSPYLVHCAFPDRPRSDGKKGPSSSDTLDFAPPEGALAPAGAPGAGAGAPPFEGLRLDYSQDFIGASLNGQRLQAFTVASGDLRIGRAPTDTIRLGTPGPLETAARLFRADHHYFLVVLSQYAQVTVLGQPLLPQHGPFEVLHDDVFCVDEYAFQCVFPSAAVVAAVQAPVAVAAAAAPSYASGSGYYASTQVAMPAYSAATGDASAIPGVTGGRTTGSFEIPEFDDFSGLELDDIIPKAGATPADAPAASDAPSKAPEPTNGEKPAAATAEPAPAAPPEAKPVGASAMPPSAPPSMPPSAPPGMPPSAPPGMPPSAPTDAPAQPPKKKKVVQRTVMTLSLSDDEMKKIVTETADPAAAAKLTEALPPSMPPQFAPPVPSGDLSAGLPPAMPPSAPPGMPPSAPPGAPPFAPPGMPPAAPLAMPPSAPPGMPPSAPPGMPPSAPPGMPPSAPPAGGPPAKKKPAARTVVTLNVSDDILADYLKEQAGAEAAEAAKAPALPPSAPPLPAEARARVTGFGDQTTRISASEVAKMRAEIASEKEGAAKAGPAKPASEAPAWPEAPSAQKAAQISKSAKTEFTIEAATAIKSAKTEMEIQSPEASSKGKVPEAILAAAAAVTSPAVVADGGQKSAAVAAGATEIVSRAEVEKLAAQQALREEEARRAAAPQPTAVIPVGRETLVVGTPASPQEVTAKRVTKPVAQEPTFREDATPDQETVRRVTKVAERARPEAAQGAPSVKAPSLGEPAPAQAGSQTQFAAAPADRTQFAAAPSDRTQIAAAPGGGGQTQIAAPPKSKPVIPMALPPASAGPKPPDAKGVKRPSGQVPRAALPDADRKAPPPPQKGKGGLIFAALLLAAIGAGAAVFMFPKEARDVWTKVAGGGATGASAGATSGASTALGASAGATSGASTTESAGASTDGSAGASTTEAPTSVASSAGASASSTEASAGATTGATTGSPVEGTSLSTGAATAASTGASAAIVAVDIGAATVASAATSTEASTAASTVEGQATTAASTEGSAGASAGASTEASTAASTASSTEASAGASTEGSTEASTGASPGASTAASTAASTGGSTEASVGTSTEASTAASTASSTEGGAGASTEASAAATAGSTAATTGASTEASTAASSGASTEASAGASTDSSTAASAASSTEGGAGASTEASTAASTEASTESSTGASTEASTGASAEASTAASTASSTEASVGGSTEASTEASSAASTGASASEGTAGAGVAAVGGAVIAGAAAGASTAGTTVGEAGAATASGASTGESAASSTGESAAGSTAGSAGTSAGTGAAASTGASAAAEPVSPLAWAAGIALPKGVVPTVVKGEFRNEVDGSILIRVPAGKAMIGADDGDVDEKPAHEVELSEYFMGKTEVTAGRYARFLAWLRAHPNEGRDLAHPLQPIEKGYTPGASGALAWSADGAPPAGTEDRPVVLVDWYDAYAYCKWAGGTLPSEAQWERAASLGAPGSGRRRFPWGDAYEKGRAQVADAVAGRDFESQEAWESWQRAMGERPVEEWPEGRIAAVGSFPKGASPLGILDMAGNVREWCWDYYAPDFYAASPASNPVNQRPTRDGTRVCRGGCWFSYPPSVRVSYRDWGAPGYRNDDVGFRLCIPGKGAR